MTDEDKVEFDKFCSDYLNNLGDAQDFAWKQVHKFLTTTNVYLPNIGINPMNKAIVMLWIDNVAENVASLSVDDKGLFSFFTKLGEDTKVSFNQEELPKDVLDFLLLHFVPYTQ